MTIGDLLRYSLLLSAARSFRALETGFMTLGSYSGAIETSVPEEVIVVPGKEGRSITVHVYVNEAAKTAKAASRPCATYINLHGTAYFHAYSHTYWLYRWWIRSQQTRPGYRFHQAPPADKHSEFDPPHHPRFRLSTRP
jgi:hypothetical protein